MSSVEGGMGSDIVKDFVEHNGRLSELSVYRYTGILHYKDYSRDQCCLCKQPFSIFKPAVNCSLCGMTACSECCSSTGEDSGLCDCCVAIKGNESEDISLHGLKSWTRQNSDKKCIYKSQLHAAVGFCFQLIFSRDKTLHHIGICPLVKYFDNIKTLNFSRKHVHDLRSHISKCNCAGRFLLIDLYLSFCMSFLSGKCSLNLQKLMVSFKRNNLEEMRVCARAFSVITESGNCSINIPECIELLGTSDELSLMYILCAFSNSISVPVDHNIIDLSDDIVVQNSEQIYPYLINLIQESKSPIVHYYATKIMVNLTLQNSVCNQMAKDPMNCMLKLFLAHLPKDGLSNGQLNRISLFISKIYENLWFYTQKIDNEYEHFVFSTVLQIIIHSLSLEVPFSHDSIIGCIHTICIKLVDSVSSHEVFGVAIKSEQITRHTEILKDERIRNPYPIPDTDGAEDQLTSIRTIELDYQDEYDRHEGDTNESISEQLINIVN